MTGVTLRRLLPGLTLVALNLLAQSTPDMYRSLYRTWREADPNLEADAATAAPEALASRAGKSAQLAAAYAAAHTAALKSAADQQTQNLQWLGSNAVPVPPDLAPASEEIRFANREGAAVAASVATFANDPDRAIQQLRQAYQREQTALDALKPAIIARQQAEEKADSAAGAAEQARTRALQEYTLLSSALSQAADAMNRESDGWAAYYSRLAEAARVPSAPASSSSAAASASVNPEPSITPVPLARYTGVWSFRPGQQFFGPEPEVMDVTVHENNGRVMGTFYGRFKVPAGGPADPVLRFDFSGDLKNTRQQTFKLITAEGAAGSIDLTPGVAFNELEVNFSTDPRPGKVQQGDVILLKQ